jgi:hypothetical protein
MRDEGFIHRAHMLNPLVIDEIKDIVPAIIERATAQANPDGDSSVISQL